MSAVAISNIMYTALHSFYPIFMAQHYLNLGTLHFSVIVASFEVSNLAMSLILGMYMTRFKRKNLIIGSNFLLMGATVSFALLPGTQEYNFFLVSVTLRVLQGIASSAI
jgi:MFS family permease